MGNISNSFWANVSKTVSTAITGLLKQILFLINMTEAEPTSKHFTDRKYRDSVDIARKEPKTSTPDKHKSNVAKRFECQKCDILKANLIRMQNIIT